MLNYSFGIQEAISDIFAGILIGALRTDNPDRDQIVSATKANINNFKSTFPTNVFQDEYAIFYEIMMSIKAKLFTLQQLNDIIDNNSDLILGSPYVDLSKLSLTQNGNQSSEAEKIEAIKANMSEMFVRLSNVYVSEDKFESSCAIFSNWYRSALMFEVAGTMAQIMSDTGAEIKEPGKRTRLYRGLDDCKAYYNKKIKVINELSAEDRIRTLVIDDDWLLEEQDGKKYDDSEAMFEIGLAEIDSTLGELRRGNMLGVLGPPKGGKTRFTNFLVSRALSLGYNVCVWSLEGTKEEWIAMQLAAIVKRDTGKSINSKDILQRRYVADKEIKECVAAARIKLATDKEFGRLSFIESTAYVEDFLDVIQSHYENENPFDVIVIDQLIDILSRTGKGKVERISQAYQELKLWIQSSNRMKVLGIMPAQLKQSVVDYLRKNPDETIDVTAGGESSETIRTPDEVIGLFSSKEERAAQLMHIYSVASRHSGNFDDFAVRCDLSCCYFYSDQKVEK